MKIKTIRKLAITNLLFSTILSYSCSKNNVTVSDTPKTISGEWRWIKSESGWGGIEMPGADSTITLKLNNDSSYLVSLNNVVKYSGNYSSLLSPDSLLVLQFDQNIEVSRLRIQKSQSVVYFNNDSCRLYDYQIADGYSHLYYRK